MEVKSIRNTNVSPLDTKIKEVQPNQQKFDTKESSVEQTKAQLSEWQESVLQIAQTYLENKSQVVNNHPLARPEYKQIETLEEALAEIEKTRLDKYHSEALGAQANLSPEQILYLFTQ